MSGRTPDHRVEVPVSEQTWSDVTFLHWRVPPAAVQAVLPRGLKAQVIDGSAWIGIVPFRMRDVRAPGLPVVPGWADFPELNARTYVSAPDGTDGVWFVRMFCPPRTFIAALRALGLPYRHADAAVRREDSTLAYRFARRRDDRRDPLFTARVEVGSPVPRAERGILLDSLTGRWNAYTWRGGRLLRFPVHHEPWPLLTATVARGRWRWDALGAPAPVGDPLVHCSPGVHARFGRPVLVHG